LQDRNKLILAGFWEGNRDQAPYADDSFEVWGLNHLHPYIPRWSRWFDFHRPEWSAANLKPEVWADQDAFLRKNHGKPIYMLEARPEYPCVRPYPIDEVVRGLGRRYFTNGLAYMVALALLEGRFAEIQVWGADMRHSEEYAIQRPCFEYWLGRCEGAGIKVVIPPSAALLSAERAYGYEDEGGMVGEALRAHREVLAKALAMKDQAVSQAQTYDGVIQTEQEWIRRWEQRSRGGIL
jgi:hypothetical protein